jgi:hypothetical protein
MIDPVSDPPPCTPNTPAADSPAAQSQVSPDRISRFHDSLVAASLRPPMIDLFACDDDAEQSALELPIRAPAVTIDPGRKA